MCNEKTAADDARGPQGCCGGEPENEQKREGGGCQCCGGNCDIHRCLPILGVLALAVAVPMVARMVKKSRKR